MQIQSTIIDSRVLKNTALTFFVIFYSVLYISDAFGKGDLAKRAERLVPLKIDANEGFSEKIFNLETGIFYRWRIISDGRDEYSFRFPELSRNIWVHQISIADKEVKPYGGIHSLEFDDEGEIDIFFIPIRPGKYNFFVKNYRNSGMLGTMVVK
jgi:hypothetical protein